MINSLDENPAFIQLVPSGQHSQRADKPSREQSALGEISLQDLKHKMRHNKAKWAEQRAQGDLQAEQ